MSLVMDRWLNDTGVLSNLRTSWNDKLEVVNDRLHLEEGQHSRGMGRLVTSHPTVVADYLESLITNTAQEYFQTLQFSKEDSPVYYEQIADFKRQVKCLHKQVSNLQYTFRSHDCNNKSHAERYSQLFEVAFTFLKQVKDYKATLKKPSLEERPVKHIHYNERTDLHTIKWSYPKRIPIEETVAAAKQALLLAQPQQHPFIRCIKAIGKGLVFAIPLLAASLLTVLKIVLWNPLECLIRGELRTISPLRWFLQELRTDNSHMRAYQSFSTQLFHQPFITEKVVEAFKQLAPQANLLDLDNAVLASEDITELAPFIEEDKRTGAIPLITYLNTMKRLCEEKNIKLQTLRTVSHFYKLHNDTYLRRNREGEEGQSIDDFLNDMSNRLRKDADIEKANAVCPYISPKALQELLNVAASSPTCREIQLSSSLVALQSVRDFLKSHSYRLKEDDEHRKTYRRYSLV